MSAQLSKLPAKSRSRSTKSYQLRVELKGVKPAVWRRIAVPSTIKLSKLHHILLAVMGWQGGHLHEFIFADAMYGQAEEEMEPGVEDESRVSLVKAAAGSSGPSGTCASGRRRSMRSAVRGEVRQRGVKVRTPGRGA